jgi:hypothetical protein
MIGRASWLLTASGASGGRAEALLNKRLFDQRGENSNFRKFRQGKSSAHLAGKKSGLLWWPWQGGQSEKATV